MALLHKLRSELPNSGFQWFPIESIDYYRFPIIVYGVDY